MNKYTEQKKIKWGIIGCGNIARKFANDLKLIDEAELTAVASRSIEKAKKFQQEHKAEKSFGSYIDLLENRDIDIVYIATPHSSHARWSIEAMKHGKHVLCEKPLSLNKNEAELIIKTSKETGRFFMEALWTRFNPTLIAVKKHIDNKELGEISYINADFSFKSDKPLNSRVLDMNLGGGAILDIGIYPVFLSYIVLGVPDTISAVSNFHQITGCDMQTSMILNYNSAQAVLYCSFLTQSGISAKISGTLGTITIHEPFHAPAGYTFIKNNKKTDYVLPLNSLGFTYEIKECHQCLKNGKTQSNLWSHQNSLDLITILDGIRKSVDLVYPQET